ncbi:MAG: stage V sporulation protein AC [Clostridiales bacterium]|jgi:stage V sporulation protein AC|nr:stage V sporulation protein AC [Clostridiales bacterium]
MDNSQEAKKKYQDLVEGMAPKSKLLSDCLKAFFVGGAICTFGQAITNVLMNFGVGKENAGTYTSIILVFLGVFFTGLGWYGKLGKHAGAGSAVPITGFANAMAAPAIEYKSEGLVLGMAAKMFTVAGPVIVYGTLTSMIVGIIYYFIK